jgi:hypothetical protein
MSKQISDTILQELNVPDLKSNFSRLQLMLRRVLANELTEQQREGHTHHMKHRIKEENDMCDAKAVDGKPFP